MKKTLAIVLSLLFVSNVFAITNSSIPINSTENFNATDFLSASYTSCIASAKTLCNDDVVKLQKKYGDGNVPISEILKLAKKCNVNEEDCKSKILGGRYDELTAFLFGGFLFIAGGGVVLGIFKYLG